ncbi:Surface antigen (D15) [uncultured Paludibacter sp.]|uniref:Surface antigen (D15) n=1 Tax=uncultured Paludibacter sp. TaxID=497635 RepID=A0A653AHE7_9BACT|nr:Surface antigen (D15) [uncultured Paludibacter sp.]
MNRTAHKTMNFQPKKIKYFLFLLAGLFMLSCNTTKYVPNGEYLLNKVKIQSDTKAVSKEDIQNYLRQTPNTKMLGLWRTQLGIYNLSGKDSTKSINRWLKKIGDEPVIYNQELTDVSEREIQKHFVNKGFMNAEVKSEVSYPKEKMINVKYVITSNKPYRLRGYTVNIAQKEIFNIASDTAESLIKTGKLFDSDVLDAERERITKKFRNLGYFNFLKEHLHYYADSTLNTHQIDLVLELNNDIENIKDTLSSPIFKKYTINKIHFYSEADKLLDQPNEKIKLDSVSKGNYEFIYEKKQNLRPNLLIETTHLIPGKFYSDQSVEKTYSSLNSLSAVKYVNIAFQQQDSNKLDTYITLTPNKLQTISADGEITYSAGYWGAGTNINYGHQNAFGGSEAVNAKGRFAYEYQGVGQNAIELGADLGIKFPTFLFPFATTDLKRKIRANTQINTTFSYRKRPKEFTGIIVGGGLKYSWSELSNIKHNFDLIDLSYVRYPWISQEYKDRFFTENSNFKYNFQDHFIMRMGYNGSYTNFNSLNPLKDYSSMNYNVEVAGNTLYALNKLLNNKPVQDGTQSYYTLFNLRFAQYAKFDYNISHHQIFDQNNRIVYHAGIGVAVPYGNASIIPFEKRYFSGGANSVRGWTAYQLGPGTYSDSIKNYINLNTQMGDIKIDLNMEYRGKIFWKLDGALFLDAGNVWTIKNYKEQPGGVFKLGSFFNQFGVAYGTGLRLDFTYFVIRLDLGLKLYNPALSRTERWRIKPTGDDFALNLAIGYPF